MSALFINDLDAGAGRMGDATQYTVNNQVGAGGVEAAWRAPQPRRRHPSQTLYPGC